MKHTTDTTENRKKSDKARKAVSVVFDVILYLFLALCIFMLIVSLTAKKNNGASNIFGYEMRLVVSDSMAKTENSLDVSGYKIKSIPKYSMVFIQRKPDDEAKAAQWYDDLQEGDVLTFAYRYDTQDIITHRLTGKTPTEHGYLLELAGDNPPNEQSPSPTQQIYTSEQDYPTFNDRFNYVIGKVVGKSLVLGYIYYGVSNPVGVALIIIVPCAAIMIWQIARIVAVVNEDKRRKAASKLADEDDKQRQAESAELQELRRKVAEMEKLQSKRDGDDGNVDQN